MTWKETRVDYEVILVLCLVLILFSRFLDMDILVTAAAILGIAALLIKPFGKCLTFLWQQLIKLLGFVNSRILLSIIFFLFLTPLALIARLFRSKDVLQLKKPEASNFKLRNHTYTAADLKDPW